MDVILGAYLVRGHLHIQCHANREDTT